MNGEYSFLELREGAWTVGLAPGNEPARGNRSGARHDFAPVCESAETLAGEITVIDLTAYSGLFIEGRVESLFDGDVDATVWARSPRGSRRTGTELDGSFRLGPLPAGLFSVMADPMFDARLTASEPVEVEAGRSDLVLTLGRGLGIRVRAVDATSQAEVDAEHTLSSDRPPVMISRNYIEPFEVDFSSLEPGTYSVVSITEDRRVGFVQGIQVKVGDEPPLIRVPVSPGASVHVAHTGPGPHSVIVLKCRDLTISKAAASEGKDAEFLAPAGEVQLWRGDQVLELTVQAGEEIQVSFGSKDKEALQDSEHGLRVHRIDTGNASGQGVPASVVDQGVELVAEGPHLDQEEIESYVPIPHVRAPEIQSGSWLTLNDERMVLVPFRGRVVRRDSRVRSDALLREIAPGQVSVLDSDLGPGAAIYGTVTESDGTPAAGQEVALSIHDRSSGGLFLMRDEFVATTRTDPEGRYRFEGVSPGPWMVGIRQAWRSGRPESEAIAPMAYRVELREGGGPARADLVLHRGHFLRGRVVDPGGSSTEGRVHGFSEGVRTASHRTFDGRFELGPLPPGEYTIQSNPPIGSDFARSNPVWAHTGQEDIVLPMNPGARFSCVATDDASGGPVWARLVLSGGEGLLQSTHTRTQSYPYEFSSLEPGTYRVTAVTPGGLVGTHGPIVLEAGVELEPLNISVRPGGYVNVGYTGAEEVAFLRIIQDGFVYDFDNLMSGSQRRCTVPTGRVEVRLGDEVRVLDVEEGDELEIDFELATGN